MYVAMLSNKCSINSLFLVYYIMVILSYFIQLVYSHIILFDPIYNILSFVIIACEGVRKQFRIVLRHHLLVQHFFAIWQVRHANRLQVSVGVTIASVFLRVQISRHLNLMNILLRDIAARVFLLQMIF